MSPASHSTRGCSFDLLKLTRFWEAAAYFSPAHAYSLHVSFLGLFPFLRSGNESLKREAVAALEAGGIFAFAVSEREHGADLLGNEFTVTDHAPEQLSATGTKYYIGNAHRAVMISVLAKRTRRHETNTSTRRAPLLFFTLRPNGNGDGNGNGNGNGSVQSMRKIRTSGIRSAYVAAFDVVDHAFPESDIICTGRDAWETVFATVNLGKFFLCFGSIGMCEHALVETLAHTRTRVLYGKPVAQMPHIRATLAHAYAKVAAMKLFAYRAVDYLHAAHADDRRYLLLAAVQKARVSSEGVKVMSLLSECIGARGFEADTYFELALRDVPLVPILEGSTHINHQAVAQFITGYFTRLKGNPPPTSPPSLAALGSTAGENPYLLTSTATNDVARVRFPHFLAAYRPLAAIANVVAFMRQVRRFRVFLRRCGQPATSGGAKQDTEVVIALGKCLSIIVYGQLVAEHCQLADVPAALVSVLLHQSIEDLSHEALRLAALPQTTAEARDLLARVSVIPQTTQRELDEVVEHMEERMRG